MTAARAHSCCRAPARACSRPVPAEAPRGGAGYCQRHFSERAATRHIPLCRDRVNRPRPPPAHPAEGPGRAAAGADEPQAVLFSSREPRRSQRAAPAAEGAAAYERRWQSSSGARARGGWDMAERRASAGAVLRDGAVRRRAAGAAGGGRARDAYGDRLADFLQSRMVDPPSDFVQRRGGAGRPLRVGEAGRRDAAWVGGLGDGAGGTGARERGGVRSRTAGGLLGGGADGRVDFGAGGLERGNATSADNPLLGRRGASIANVAPRAGFLGEVYGWDGSA